MRFNMIYEANDIEHRLAKPNPSWTTNAQVERMNRTSKEVTVKRCVMRSTAVEGVPHRVRGSIFCLLTKTSSGLTSYEYISKN